MKRLLAIGLLLFGLAAPVQAAQPYYIVDLMGYVVMGPFADLNSCSQARIGMRDSYKYYCLLK